MAFTAYFIFSFINEAFNETIKMKGNRKLISIFKYIFLIK